MSGFWLAPSYNVPNSSPDNYTHGLISSKKSDYEGMEK